MVLTRSCGPEGIGELQMPAFEQPAHQQGRGLLERVVFVVRVEIVMADELAVLDQIDLQLLHVPVALIEPELHLHIISEHFLKVGRVTEVLHLAVEPVQALLKRCLRSDVSTPESRGQGRSVPRPMGIQGDRLQMARPAPALGLPRWVEAIMDDVEGKVVLHAMCLVPGRLLALVGGDRGRWRCQSVLREPGGQRRIGTAQADQADDVLDMHSVALFC